MFRMLKLNPPNGWRAVAWELAIVTLGVLIALGAQQWAESKAAKAKARGATAALGKELHFHYANSVEFRVVAPCIVAQIERLQQRILSGGDRLDPAPVYSEEGFGSYVLRMPSRSYNESAWQAAIADGTTSHLQGDLRRQMSDHYQQVQTIIAMRVLNDIATQRTFSLSRTLPLDPSVKFAMVESLDELRGRVEFMSLMSGQLLGHIVNSRMVPESREVKAIVEKSGTYQFCGRQRLPLRAMADAMKPMAYNFTPAAAPAPKQ